MSEFDDDFEDVVFDQFGVGTTGNFAVAHNFAHTGTKFVSPADLSEKLCDYRILRKWRKSLGRSVASVRLVFDGEVEAHDAAGSGEPEVALVEVQVVHAGA
ncbi:hypothetical protein MASR1M12_03670 [Erysipelotrichia bacterium]